MSMKSNTIVETLTSDHKFHKFIIPVLEKFRDEWEESSKPKYGFSTHIWQHLYAEIRHNSMFRAERNRQGLKPASSDELNTILELVSYYNEEVWGRNIHISEILSCRRDAVFETAAPYNEKVTLVKKTKGQTFNPLPVERHGLSFDESNDFGMPPEVIGESEEASNQQEKQMSKTDVPKIETRTFIDGIDATAMSDEQLMSLISKLENDVVNLGTIKVVSTKVQKKIADMNDSVVVLAELLDER